MRWLTSTEATGAAMDALTISGTHLSPEREFDRKVEIRAENHERLRGRNNVTLCRSPTRDFDSGQIKNELKEKRHQEFLRRRSVSPEPNRSKCAICSSKAKTRLGTFTTRRRTPSSKSEMLHRKVEMSSFSPIVQTQRSREADDPSNNTWALLWLEPITQVKHKNNQARQQSSTSTVIMEPSQHWIKHTNRRDNSIKVQTASLKMAKEASAQTETVHPKKNLREISVQTEYGLVTVKESDVQRLSDYLQEALWREEAVKKKLAALQESGSNLLNSTDMIWILKPGRKTRCSEDLLRSKIKTLEAQLQVCLQKIPKDGVKKLVLQMEKQRVTYEEKALVALQKATQEKAEALSRAETLQEALITVQAEALRWQSLFEELKLNSGQLKEKQHISMDQLQQLHSQLEFSRATEDELKEEIAAMRQEKQELQYNICLLEDDNQTLREEIQNFQDGDNTNHNFFMRSFPESPEAEPRLTANRDSHLEEQLQHAQQKLQLKEKECEELQTELHAMEQECQSSQARLSQCREELRQLSHRRSTPTSCSSWWRVWLFLLLLLTVAGLAMLWMWHPPFREQAEVLYSDIETRIEDYLIEMVSPRYSGCFRPV
ncbi:TRAF3-interacting JNK-activating modulator isoform X1 [Oryzias latipes]|uniref:TRAF3 interacting protein 3 n=1 Tax=Oryzias latipes TaxID=8090 RepID=H2LMP8_ORYLA|nr:TRAF3-interacting JNK-activating modulator isoform X1 [Oryzias latipes]